MAQWLREHGVDEFVDEVVGELAFLAGLGQGDLAEVAGDLVRGWKPQLNEWETQEKEK